MLSGIKTTCQQCRTAKVKCDQEQPCSRCTRLGLSCCPTGPSRRGRTRNSTEHPRRAPSTTLVKEVCDSLVDAPDLVAKTPGGVHHYGILFLIREFLGIGLRKKSASVMAKAFQMCEKAEVLLSKQKS